jgi:uncharacterized protein with PhoU and TrkA domain
MGLLPEVMHLMSVLMDVVVEIADLIHCLNDVAFQALLYERFDIASHAIEMGANPDIFSSDELSILSDFEEVVEFLLEMDC